MTFSMMFVQASERRSSSGSPSFVTVSISSSPSRIEVETPSSPFRDAGQGCEEAPRLCWRPSSPMPAATRAARTHAWTSAGVPKCCAPYESGSAEWLRRGRSRSDRFGEGLRAVDDERRGMAGSRPRSMRLSISACTVAAFSVAPSTSPSGCLSPFASTPTAATRVISSSM